jgi:hypothetical protein
MVEISDKFDTSTQGNFFSSYKKNLGNKLFIYACSRIISDLLDYDLICPKNSLIRRENQETNMYEVLTFPFGSIENRKRINSLTFTINDNDIASLGSIENLINRFQNHGFFVQTYFSKYDYIKPYKNMVKEYYKSLISPKRENNDLVIMLRNSNDAGNFMLPDNYYLDIIKKENFNNLYISLDHKNRHTSLLNKLKYYNPTIIDGNILEVFSEITSFKKIISSQGTFSFWASFLSNAEKIYWPMTNDGPNSNNQTWGSLVNLKVDDEDRYEHINVENIYINE